MITAVCQSNAAAAAAATRHIATMTIRRTIVEPLMTRMPLHMKTAVCSASFVKSSFTPKAYARCLSISAMALDEIPAEKTSKAPSTSSGDSSRGKSSSSRGQSLMAQQFRFAEIAEESASDLPPPPLGVSPLFHIEHHTLSERMHHNTHLTDGLVALAKCVTTLNDAEIFSTVMRTWKISRHFLSRSDAAEIFRALRSAGANDTVLRMLCNRSIYRLGPAKTEIVQLMAHYRSASLSPSALKDEEEHIAQLDSLYKCFSLILFHEMSPNPAQYSILITAGAYGNTEEGLRRSTLTAAELASLGWKLDDAAVLSLAHANIEQGHPDKALSILSAHPDVNKTASSIVKMRAYLALKDLKGLSLTLNALVKAPPVMKGSGYDGVPESTFGLEFWPPYNEILADLSTYLESIVPETSDIQHLKSSLGQLISTK
ncbi:hypothetical protein BASA50_001657 [Batrachochytrium salamandrivorans]|uniref:Uncharacterized protein n=1 Tax=Batrachochytrium salamandrivorans TaxID=1357716 RepID=A0ABQ8FNJ7_9FUNG|nr:hypothetical protein BASA50_001657 [Batrachochytrium salamandrivorans]KAH9250506.1 hypothetical protein BASA81_011682 [Batrachochytrium salamandrivorans]